MYKKIVFMVLLLNGFSLSAQVNNGGPVSKYFDVIISLSAANTNNKVSEIKAFIESFESGLVFEGYCESQKCLLLRASMFKFNSPGDVANFLKSKFGIAILDYKDYTFREFYKICTFSTEAEYQYFKKTYK